MHHAHLSNCHKANAETHEAASPTIATEQREMAFHEGDSRKRKTRKGRSVMKIMGARADLELHISALRLWARTIWTCERQCVKEYQTACCLDCWSPHVGSCHLSCPVCSLFLACCGPIVQSHSLRDIMPHHVVFRACAQTSSFPAWVSTIQTSWRSSCKNASS